MSKPKKPALVRVLSDDLMVPVGREGELLAIHEGEWVEVYQFESVADTKLANQLRGLSTALDAIDDADPERMLKTNELVAEHEEKLIVLLKPRLVRWCWTDDGGEPLPQPREDPDVLTRLRYEELFWLSLAVSGKTGSVEKNASRPSQTSSSATPRRTSRR
ncbi:MAG TPA: hypothetical protein VJB57_04080 [Dehalococcoidia bacterium]|nr:hypothetical protein [Dehalococcoidia bacterium]